MMATAGVPRMRLTRLLPVLIEPAKVIVSLAGVVGVWWLFAASGIVSADLFPPPPAVWAAALEMYDSGTLWLDLSASLKRAIVGFCIGSIVGIIVGLLTSRTRFFRFALNPFLTLARPIPVIALVPVAIVWFGIGDESKYAVISFAVGLTVWLNTHHGMEHVPQTYIRASRSLGAPLAREFFQVVIPASAPHILAGLRMGAALAFLSLVAAELTGASSGIGYRLQEARQYLRMDRMFVGLIQLGVLGALLDLLFVVLGRRVVHWEQ
ncbi:MAG: ABC transporter permease [Lautropia sp.]